MKPRRPDFIDREAEVAELQQIVRAAKPKLVLVSGRRRVGKTYLLQHAFADARTLYFLAGDTTPEINKQDLLAEIAEFFGEVLDPNDFVTWRSILRFLAARAEAGPLVVVLDEFQHLMKVEDNLPSQISAVYERDVRQHPLILAVSGSELSMMDTLLSGGKSMFGRWAWAAKLSPFDYYDAAQMFPGRALRDCAYMYGIYGGTPRYLAALAPDEPVADSVARTFLSPRGEVHVQAEHVIEQERGIRATEEYKAVLRAIADGRVVIIEIEQATGIEVGALKPILKTLERLEYIWRERNFDAAHNVAWQYRIADPALRFWFHFVEANRSRLVKGSTTEVWRQRVAPALDDYMGSVFPAMVRQAYGRLHARWKLPGVANGDWSRWEGQDRNRRAIELDVVARCDDRCILTGEFKWSSKPVGPSVHQRLLDNLRDLAASGRKWAHDALEPQHCAGYLYVSAAGFAPEFYDLASTDSKIKLITLEEMYRPI